MEEDTVDMANEEEDEKKSLSKENASLKAQNERLKERLQSSQDYAEELRLRLEALGLALEKARKGSGRAELSREASSQTDEEDLKEASLKWRGEIPLTKWDLDKESIVDQVRRAAGNVEREQFLAGMAFEETSGLYYDFKSGYYYDAERNLYYDGASGTYYSYDYEKEEYQVYSTVALGTTSKKSGKKKQKTKKKRKKSAEVDGDNDKNGERAPRDVEEGEVSSESDDESDDESEEASSDDTTEAAGHRPDDTDDECEFDEERIPPCARLIVKSSDSIPPGSLFLVPCTGGTVGRVGLDHAVILPGDSNVSRKHASITFRTGKFFVKDVGSVNGTVVDGKMLVKSSDEETRSNLVVEAELGHGSMLEVGSTKLLCHVHPGKETCFECEPGRILEAQPIYKIPEFDPSGKEKARRTGLRQLKAKYGLRMSDDFAAGNVKLPESYEDRAGKRRRELGSDNPYEKTDAAHVDKALGKTNKGFGLLAKMGWKEGQGLGRKGAEGRKEPVRVEQRVNVRAGLGTGVMLAALDVKRDEVWQKTKERFEQAEKSEKKGEVL